MRRRSVAPPSAAPSLARRGSLERRYSLPGQLVRAHSVLLTQHGGPHLGIRALRELQYRVLKVNSKKLNNGDIEIEDMCVMSRGCRV